MLFNFPAPKHIARSFLLAYSTELKLQMTDILQSIPELQRILPDSSSSDHILRSYITVPHNSFVPFEFHNQLQIILLGIDVYNLIGMNLSICGHKIYSALVPGPCL